MAKRVKVTKTVVSQATDYLSEVNLGITEKDLSNKALFKKFLQELKEAKADNLALADSLEAAQNALEIKKQEYTELDKQYAMLQAEAKPKKGLGVIDDLSLLGMGTGLGLLVTSFKVGAICAGISGLLYAITKFYEG